MIHPQNKFERKQIKKTKIEKRTQEEALSQRRRAIEAAKDQESQDELRTYL